MSAKANKMKFAEPAADRKDLAATIENGTDYDAESTGVP
jgi:hypothetical protein